MNRRAQGISVNVIIIAAIALVVMVILIALVLNTGQGINTSVSSCESQGDGVYGQDYACAAPGESCPDGFTSLPTRSCSESENPGAPRCCIPI